jgi:hypothetical protein
MPIEWVTADEWERLTGSRGSVYIGPAPVRRPKNREVFLCPTCYEVLGIPRSDVFRCAACSKTLEDPRAT